MLSIRFKYIEQFSRNYDLKKKVKQILTSNISEIYGPIILPKELDRELSKIHLEMNSSKCILIPSTSGNSYNKSIDK